MDLTTALLVFPLLSAPQEEGLSELIERYGRSQAADSAVALTRRLPALSGTTRETARFLLAIDFAELGLGDLAVSELEALTGEPCLGPAASVALLRIRSDSGSNDAVVHEASAAPWDRMKDEDFGESLYRVARAFFLTRRYPEARDWLAHVPEASPYFLFARYLLAQTEYALGHFGRAVEAAEPIF